MIRRKSDCEWTRPEDADYDVWQTGCEQEFMFESDGPTENRFKFCPYCGGRLTLSSSGDSGASHD